MPKRSHDRNHKMGGYCHWSVFSVIFKFCQFMADISYFLGNHSKIQIDNQAKPPNRCESIETLCKNRAKYKWRNNKENKHCGALSRLNRYFSEMKCLRKSNRHANWFELNFNQRISESGLVIFS